MEANGDDQYRIHRAQSKLKLKREPPSLSVAVFPKGNVVGAIVPRQSGRSNGVPGDLCTKQSSTLDKSGCESHVSIESCHPDRSYGLPHTSHPEGLLEEKVHVQSSPREDFEGICQGDIDVAGKSTSKAEDNGLKYKPHVQCKKKFREAGARHSSVTSRLLSLDHSCGQNGAGEDAVQSSRFVIDSGCARSSPGQPGSLFDAGCIQKKAEEGSECIQSTERDENLCSLDKETHDCGNNQKKPDEGSECIQSTNCNENLCNLEKVTQDCGNAADGGEQNLPEAEPKLCLENVGEPCLGHHGDGFMSHKEALQSALYRSWAETTGGLDSNSTYGGSESSREKHSRSVPEIGAKFGSETARNNRNSSQFCSEDAVPLEPLESHSCNTERLDNLHSTCLQPLPFNIANVDDMSSTCHPEKALENTGCSANISHELSKELKVLDSSGECWINDQKVGPVSSAKQRCADRFSETNRKFKPETFGQPIGQFSHGRLTSEEPCQATCPEKSEISTSVVSDFPTKNLTTTRDSSGKIQLVHDEDAPREKSQNSFVDAVDNEEVGWKDRVLKPRCSEGEDGAGNSSKRNRKEHPFETFFRRSKIVGSVLSPRIVPETSKSFNGKKGESFHFPSFNSFKDNVNGNLCDPLLSSCNNPVESALGIQHARADQFSGASERSPECERGPRNQQDALKEEDVGPDPKEMKKGKFLARFGMARVQGHTDLIPKVDGLGGHARKSEAGHSVSSTVPIISGKRSKQIQDSHSFDHSEQRSFKRVDKFSSVESKKRKWNLKHRDSDFVEERPVNCLKSYYNGRPKRHETKLESSKSGDAFDCRSSGFSMESSACGSSVRKEVLFGPPISSFDKEAMTGKFATRGKKRKASDEFQETVSRPGSRVKQHKPESLFEGDADNRSDNDTLLTFRDRLVLQRQADGSRRTGNGARKESELKENHGKKIDGDFVLAEKPTKEVAISSKQYVSEQKPLSGPMSPMLKDKSLKLLTRDIAKQALLEAGFKIELRPRRSRDYQDSVYVSPDGHAYWSVPKAWEALKKLQAEDSSCVSGSHEKVAVSSTKGEESKQTLTHANGKALKEVFSRFGNDERLQRALTRHNTCKGSNLGIAQNGLRHAHNHTRQSDMTNADLTDILLGEMGLLKRVSMKFSSQKRSRPSECTVLASAKFSAGKRSNHSKHTDLARPTLRDRDCFNEKRQSKWKKGGKHTLAKLELQRSGGMYSAKKVQVVCPLQVKEDKRHCSKMALNQKLLEIKSTHAEIEDKKNDTYMKKKYKKGENPKPRSGLRLEVRQSNVIGSEESSVHSALTIFAWMIDRGAVLERERILFAPKTDSQVLKEGVVTHEGILCSCCNTIFTANNFQTHAGSASSDRHEDLVIESGKSLLECQLKAWDAEIHLRKVQNYIGISDDDTNDDSCLLCGDGGDLICCDGCPSTFHVSCLEIDDIPDGDWYCAKCRCGVCCCRHHDEQKEDPAILWCNQCERRYHLTCLRGSPFSTDREVFCHSLCKQVFSNLRDLVGVSHSLCGGFSWSLLRCLDEDKVEATHKIKQIDCHSKLAVALLVIKECFNPMIDPRTNIDMITHAMYNRWSDFDRLNYTGFYTAILEKEGEIISVATIRMHGIRLAEMPLIGTREKYRRQGMCRLLVGIIEKLLSSLHVASFILPAIPELFETWTHAFGFKPLHSSLKSALKDISMMVFPGTELLYKSLSASPSQNC